MNSDSVQIYYIQRASRPPVFQVLVPRSSKPQNTPNETKYLREERRRNTLSLPSSSFPWSDQGNSEKYSRD